MPNILTPITLFNDFDDSLALNAEAVGQKVADGVKYEYIYFSGRQTEKGRVKIFATFASKEETPDEQTLLVFPDSSEGIDENILKMFVDKGYSALMVDYRGEWEGLEYGTRYPEDISYANTVKCGRYKNFVDESADKTSWYEWVGVGIYARKYILERTGSVNIGVVGIRDGGEIAWKLAVAKKLSCIVPVCSAGWLAYAGISKFKSDEQNLDSERYRFIAGVDSQAFAPYVRCPVMLLCSTNDARFDYDRAYDTFSRVNSEYASGSVISYSIPCDSTIDFISTSNMFMFLDKYLKHLQVFIPAQIEVTVGVDKEQNLIATAKLDDQGVIEEFGAYMAEDCVDPSVREWSQCLKTEKIGEHEYKAYLDIFEETSVLFVLCYARYVNGFTVWSKMAVKKISGRFKNTCGKCRVLYTSKKNTDGFCIADPCSLAVGGIFFTEDEAVPHIVTKAKDRNGIYSECGLTMYRLSNPKYAPEADNVLKIDVFCDETNELTLIIEDGEGETYKYSQSILGGVWQSLVLESKLFKTINGNQLADYGHNLRLCITCEGKYAVNNLMWL